MTNDEASVAFDADARERITARLVAGGAEALAKILAPSIDLAGGQLEHMKPGVAGPGRGGFYIGAAAMVERGTVLVVLANGRKVLQLQLRLGGAGFGGLIEECRHHMRSLMEHSGMATPEASAIMAAVDEIITQDGGDVGAKTPQLPQEQCVRLLGMLFEAVPEVEQLVDSVEAMWQRGLCPAIVGLTGPTSRSGIAAAWPISFPLAPYFDAVIPPEPKRRQGSSASRAVRTAARARRAAR